MPELTTITDREGDQLELRPVTDTLFIGSPWNPDEIWAFDVNAVRKLRDVCNEFLASQGADSC